MTLTEFRQVAQQQIGCGSAFAGSNFIVDVRDDTVYEFLVWANKSAIASDRRLTRDDGHVFHTTKRWAKLRVSTLFVVEP